MRFILTFFATFIFVSFVRPLPIDPSLLGSLSPSHIEPGTLLGRRYSLQNHASLGGMITDTAGQPYPRYYASRQFFPRRLTPFPKYLAARAAADYVWPRGDVDYVSDVGAGSYGDRAAASDSTTSVTPTSSLYQTYDTSVTLVPRPTNYTHAAEAKVKAKAKHTKSAASKDVKHTRRAE